MTTPRSPEGEMVDIMELDQQIEGLRLGSAQSEDRALMLLLELRDDVDQRAATLLGQLDDARDEWPAPPVAVPVTRRRRHHRLAVVPIAGALVLASTGVAAALSGSPHAALYPLHRLIFGATTNSSGQVTRDLAQARVLLNHAATLPYASRAGDLAQVHVLLTNARLLLPGAGSARGQLSAELSAAQARLAQLEIPPVTATTPSPSPSSGPAGDDPSPNPEASSGESGASTGESEPSGVAPAGGETEVPRGGTPVASAPETEAPDPAPSAAPTHVSGWRNDRPGGSESEAPEASDPPEAGQSAGIDN